MNKFAIFFRKYGHKIFTFCIGLAFLAGCAFLAFLGVNRVYHLFKPEHIYEEGVNSDLIWKGAPFDELRASGTEAGTAEFFERYIANYIKQDFPSYTNTLELNTDYFISYGIWQAIAVNGQGIYANQGDGSFLVPKEDVEKYARLNFDFVGDLEFHDVEICGAFNYERLSGCYRVQPNDKPTFLVPKVLEVKYDDVEGVYTVLVDCYVSDGLSEEDVTADKTKFSKRLSLTLLEHDETHEINGQEVAVTDYYFTSCALVDETIDNTPGVVEEEDNLANDPNVVT